MNKKILYGLLKKFGFYAVVLTTNVVKADPTAVDEIATAIQSTEGLNYFTIMDAINIKLAPYFIFYDTETIKISGVTEVLENFYKNILKGPNLEGSKVIADKIESSVLTKDEIIDGIIPIIKTYFHGGMALLEDLYPSEFSKNILIKQVLPAIRGKISEESRKEYVDMLCQKIKQMDGSKRVQFANVAGRYFAKMGWIELDNESYWSIPEVSTLYPNERQYHEHIANEVFLKSMFYYVDNQEEADRVLREFRTPAQFPDRFPTRIKQMLQQLPADISKEVLVRLSGEQENKLDDGNEKLVQLYLGICKKLIEEQHVPQEEIFLTLNPQAQGEQQDYDIDK